MKVNDEKEFYEFFEERGIKPMKNPNKKAKLQNAIFKFGITQGKLAEIMGISVVQVNRVINGKSNGSMEFWKLAAKALECDVADIIE